MVKEEPTPVAAPEKPRYEEPVIPPVSSQVDDKIKEPETALIQPKRDPTQVTAPAFEVYKLM